MTVISNTTYICDICGKKSDEKFEPKSCYNELLFMICSIDENEEIKKWEDVCHNCSSLLLNTIRKLSKNDNVLEREDIAENSYFFQVEEDGRPEYNLRHPVDGGVVHVRVNEVHQRRGHDYTIDDCTLIFASTLKKNDYVTVRISKPPLCDPLKMKLPSIKLRYQNEIFYATKHSVGIDVSTLTEIHIPSKKSFKIPTGVYIDGYTVTEFLKPEIQVRPRSSLTEQGLFVPVGTVDPDYEGEIKVGVFNATDQDRLIPANVRIGQLVPGISLIAQGVPRRNKIRGAGGFGSTGEKHDKS